MEALNAAQGGLPETPFACDKSSTMSPTPTERADRNLASRAVFSTPVEFYTSRLFPPIRIAGDADTDESPDRKDRYEVRIIDNDHNTYQEVMDITMLALDLSDQEAYAVAWEVDHKGSCVVAIGPGEEAEALAQIIRTIGIEVLVNPLAAGAT